MSSSACFRRVEQFGLGGAALELGPRRHQRRRLGRLGAWDTASWWNGASDLGWVAGDDAAFSGAAGTVTILNGVSANNLIFNTAGYTVTGNSLTLTGGTIAANTNATISSLLAGVSGLTVTGTGTLTLNGSAANTYTGGTSVNSGTLLLDLSNMAGATNLINNGNALTMGGGATLSIKGNASGATSQTFNGLTLASGVNAVTVNSNGGSGTTLALNTITQNAGSGATVKFTLPATGSITTSSTDTNGMIGGWAIIDNGNNTYSWAHGGTSGTNAISAAATTATPSPTANWAPGTAAYTLGGNQTVNSIIETGDIKIPTGDTLTVASGGIILQSNNFWMQPASGTVYLTSGLASGELFLHSADASKTDQQIYVNIVNNGSTPLILVKDGPGTVYITGAANTYTGGTIINGGILSDVASHTGNGLGSANGPLTINNGAFNFAETGYTAISVGVGSLNGSSGAVIENLGSGTPTFTVGNNNTSGTYAGVITNNVALTKTGTGTLLLSGVNTYTGQTTVSGGILALANAGAAGTGTIGNSAIVVNSGATLLTTTADVTGYASTATLTVSGGTLLKGPGNFHESLGRPITLAAGTIATSDNGSSANGDYYNLDGLTISTSANSGTSYILAAPGGGGQIKLRLNGSNYPTLNAATGSTLAVSANLANFDASDNLNINGLGTGIVVLSGSNSYSGATNINGGLLQFATSSAIPSGGIVNVNAGGGLLAAGPYTTVSGWLGSNVISGTSAGFLALTATGSDSEPLNMTGYPNLGLGATGSLTLTGSYTQGGTVCNLGGGGGTLTFPWAIPSGSALVIQPGTVVLTNPPSSLGSLASAGSGAISLVMATSASGTPLTLTIGGNNASTTFAGAISDQSAANPAAVVNLVKTGTGTLTMAGLSAYAGTTTVNAGGLSLTGGLSSGTLALGGGAFSYAAPSARTQTFATTTVNSAASAINNTVSGDVLNLARSRRPPAAAPPSNWELPAALRRPRPTPTA